MRKKFTFSLLLSIVIFYTFTNNSNNTAAPAKAWNSCANAGCHASSANTKVDSIILLHPTTGAVMTGFYPDSTYKIRLVGSTVAGTGVLPNFGFQLRGINVSSTLVGTFQTPFPTNTGIATGIQMLTNSAPLASTGGKYIVEPLWKAPTGNNTITLQAVLNAVNGASGSVGDSFSNTVKSETYNVLGIVGTLSCANRRLIGNVSSGTPAAGVSFKVPYTAGNGGAHFGQTVTSTGVTGLTATLAAGNFTTGNDSLTYIVSGTASGPGTANFALNIGLKTCSVIITVTAPAGVITSLDCPGGRTIGSLTNGVASSGVSFKIPYTGGNTGTHSGQIITSTGITGLTATLASGNFANGNDSLTYTVTGTPIGVGTADFALNIGARSCNYGVVVNAVPGTIATLNCASGKLLATLMNGSATSITDSFKIPYTGGNGGVHGGQIVNSTGVTGLSATLNSGSFKTGSDSVTYSISGTPTGTGSATFALNLAGKTCNFIANVLPPVGVITTLNCGGGTVTGTMSAGIAASSVSFTIPYTGGNAGTYTTDTINSATVTGLKAILQAGLFANGAGSLTYIVSGVPSGAGTAEFTVIRGGQSCAFTITVNAGLIGAIDCAAGTTSGTAVAGAAASSLSFSVPYSGGNGGAHGGQTINSTNISGLTATLSADSFVTGAGSVTYNVIGTPSAVGNANFAVNIGGKTCTYVLTVGPGAIGSINCGAGTSSGTLIAASPASGVSFNIPYTAGNGGLHNGQIVNSTGVTGLTATLGSGNFATGNGSLTYFITGTPSTFGTADFFLNIGGKNCLFSISVSPAIGVISALNCPNGTTIGALTSTIPANGVSFSIPYTGGNNGSHSGDIVNSTGVTGLSATLSSGLFATGNGNLTYTVAGTPVGAGSASFALNIGGKMCTYNIAVKLQQGTIATLECGQISTTGSLKGDVSASGVSFKVPYTGGNGGLYSIIDTNSTGVTGFIALSPADTFAIGSDTLRFNVTGMSTSGGVASFTILVDGKTCTHSIPVDLPNAKINGGLECSNIARTGTLVRTETASGVSFSTNYTLGNNGIYSAQTINSSGVTGLTATIMADTLKLGAGTLMFNISGTPASAGTATFGVTIGGKTCNFPFPVIQPIGTVTTLDCDSIKLTYTEDFMAQIPLAGVSLSVPYTGANGGSYPAFSIASTGVIGMTAAANAGIFATGNGNINFTVTGTPINSGNAQFTLQIGGKTCNYIIPVKPLLVGTINSLSCNDGQTTGVLIEGTATNGTSFTVPYDGGNRGYHFGHTVTSTGVTGLTAKLNSGQFAIGFGHVAYTITGTPSAEGIASFALNIGGKQCTYSIPVRSSTGEVMNISCDKGQISSSIMVGTLNPGVFFTIPYQGGNGGPMSPQSITSGGVTGLIAQSAGGVLNFGDGVLRYNLSGTTTNGGWAEFKIEVGRNQNCKYAVFVNGTSSILNGSDKFEVYKYENQIKVNNHKEDLNYSIIDLTGKNIKESVLRKTENTIDLKGMNLNPGTYILVLQGEKNSTSIKFVAE
jgi:hypothetical protein